MVWSTLFYKIWIVPSRPSHPIPLYPSYPILLPGQFLSWQSFSWLSSPGQPSPTSLFKHSLAFNRSFKATLKRILTLPLWPQPHVLLQLPQVDQEVHSKSSSWSTQSIRVELAKPKSPGQGASVHVSVCSPSPSQGWPPWSDAVQARARLLKVKPTSMIKSIKHDKINQAW